MSVDEIMDTSDIDYENVDDPITLDYERQQFGSYDIKEKAFNSIEDVKLDQNLLNNKNCVNVSGMSNIRCSSLKQRYKCCPISVKLVDCAKFPWYYKFKQKTKSLENNVDMNKNQEEPDQVSSESDVDDLICLNPTCVKHKVIHNKINTYIPKYKESAKRSCLYNEKQFSKKTPTNACIVNGHRRTLDCSDVDFKKNTGLIGMRVRHGISSNCLKQSMDKQINYEARVKSIKSRDMNVTKSSRKDLTTTRPVSNKKNIDITKPSQLFSIDNCINKETSLFHHNDSTYASYNKINNSLSPVLKLNIQIKKKNNHLTKPTNINVTHNKNMAKTFPNKYFENKHDDIYSQDATLSHINEEILSKNIKSPILKSNIENLKMLPPLEFRSNSPIFPCKNNISTQINGVLPQSDIFNNSRIATNDEQNYLCYLKENVVQSENSTLENKQKNVNIFNKGNNKIQLPVSIKLKDIVENLYKRKFLQKDVSTGSKMTNLKENITQPKKTDTADKDNREDNKVNNDLSFKNINNTKSWNSSAFSSQHQRFSLQNFKQRHRHDQTSFPYNFESGYRNLIKASHKIPHKHIRIPSVLSVLLNTSKQSISLAHKNKTVMLEECVTNPAINSLSKGSFTESKSGILLSNDVQRAGDKSNNVLLDQNMERTGYSPPILPIPTYQTTFEYLANLSSGDSIPLNQNINDFGNQTLLEPISTLSPCSNYYNSNYSEMKVPIGKTKLRNTLDSRLKISLEREYKTRVNEFGHAPIVKSLRNTQHKLKDGNLYQDSLSCLKNTQNRGSKHDDKGYDSDLTVIL